jgi:hypothetical protein
MGIAIILLLKNPPAIQIKIQIQINTHAIFQSARFENLDQILWMGSNQAPDIFSTIPYVGVRKDSGVFIIVYTDEQEDPG